MDITHLLTAPGSVWSVGTPAAVMGFTPPSPTTHLRVAPDARLLAFEAISSAPRGWTQGIALCLPAVRRVRHAPIRRMDADPGAIHPQDRTSPVFDMGRGDGVVRVLFRPDPVSQHATLALRGQDWTAIPPILSGTWIADTPLARIEHWQPTGPAPIFILGGRAPRTTPLPAGHVACAHVFPPHPLRAGIDHHAPFQRWLAEFGQPRLWALKQQVLAALQAGRFQDIATDRHGMATIRVALRQHLFLTGAPPPLEWLRRYDRPLWRSCHPN
ncbi:MAG TPA: hypothetical protein VGC40_01560 [Paenirhodobacter sp.]